MDPPNSMPRWAWPSDRRPSGEAPSCCSWGRCGVTRTRPAGWPDRIFNSAGLRPCCFGALRDIARRVGRRWPGAGRLSRSAWPTAHSSDRRHRRCTTSPIGTCGLTQKLQHQRVLLHRLSRFPRLFPRVEGAVVRPPRGDVRAGCITHGRSRGVAADRHRNSRAGPGPRSFAPSLRIWRFGGRAGSVECVAPARRTRPFR
jgi:hypothetical protein